MQQNVNKLLYFRLSNFLLICSYILCLTIFTLSCVIGSEHGDVVEDIEIHPLRTSSLQTHNPDVILDTPIPNLLTDPSVAQRREVLTSEIIEENPLISSQQTNPLISFTHRYVIDDQSLEESPCCYKLRVGAKILAALYGASGGVPYIEVCCKAGQGILVLCVAFASGNIIASGAATIWAGLRIMQAFDPISEEEKKILQSRTSCNVLKHLTCNFLGVVACIPGTYSVYKYNQQKFLVIPGFLNNYIFSTVGYYELFNPSSLFQKLLSKIRCKDVAARESDEFKEYFSKQIQEHVVPTIVSDSKARSQLFVDAPIADDQFLDSLADEDQFEDTPLADDTIVRSARNQPHKDDTIILDDTSKVKKFIKNVASIKSEQNTTEPPEAWKRGCPRTTAQTLSMIFPVANTIVNYLLNYQLSNLLVDSPLICHPFAIITTLPILLIDALANYETSSGVFDGIYNKVRKRDRATFMSTYYPTLNVLIPIVSITLTCLSVTGAWVVAREAVQDSFFDVFYMAYIIPVMALIDIAISQSFQMRDLLHDVVHYLSTFRKGTVADTIKKVGKLEKLKSTISNSNSFILNDFKDRIKYSFTDSEDTVLLSDNQI